MRVLHVLEAVEAGVSRHVSDLVRHVPAEHLVLAPPERVGGFTDVRALDSMEAAGAEVTFAPMRRSPAHPGNVRAAASLRRLIGARRPDVVHGHASIGGALARVVATGTPAVRVYTPHGLLPNRGAIALERLLGRLTDAFISVSRGEADLVAELGLVGREKIAIVPNGIDPEPPDRPVAADLRTLLGVEGGVPLVGMVARLAAQKAPDVFIDACAAVARSTDASFVLIGDGPMRADVASLIGESGMGERFLHLPGLHDAFTVMPQLDAFVLTSRYEAGPYAPLEAMRAGTPVVLTDVVGNRDAVIAERSGLLAPPGDAEGIAAAVVRVLEEPGLAERLAAGGRAAVAERFDVAAMAAGTAAVYRSLLS